MVRTCRKTTSFSREIAWNSSPSRAEEMEIVLLLAAAFALYSLSTSGAGATAQPPASSTNTGMPLTMQAMPTIPGSATTMQTTLPPLAPYLGPDTGVGNEALPPAPPNPSPATSGTPGVPGQPIGQTTDPCGPNYIGGLQCSAGGGGSTGGGG